MPAERWKYLETACVNHGQSHEISSHSIEVHSSKASLHCDCQPFKQDRGLSMGISPRCSINIAIHKAVNQSHLASVQTCLAQSSNRRSERVLI